MHFIKATHLCFGVDVDIQGPLSSFRLVEAFSS